MPTQALVRKDRATPAALIWHTYRSLPEMPGSFGQKDHAEQLRALFLESERGHRRFTGGAYALTATAAAEYFAAVWLHRYAMGAHKLPSMAEALTLRPDVVRAAMVAAAHRDILAAWAATVPAEFLALDYVAMANGAPSLSD